MCHHASDARSLASASTHASPPQPRYAPAGPHTPPQSPQAARTSNVVAWQCLLLLHLGSRALARHGERSSLGRGSAANRLLRVRGVLSTWPIFTGLDSCSPAAV